MLVDGFCRLCLLVLGGCVLVLVLVVFCAC